MVSARSVAKTDVVVIGGGPAGLAAAVAVRRRGLEVVVLDRAEPPIDKACGEGLMPDAVAALEEIGIKIDHDLGFRFRGIRFLDDEAVAEAAFPHETGLGLRRTALHQLLITHAEAAGVHACWRARIDGVDSSSIRVNGEKLSCRWVVAADGLHSPVARALGLRPVWTGPRRIGLRQHFRVRPWADLVEVYWNTGCQAYVTPISQQEVCVALIGAAPSQRMSDLSNLFPRLAARLGGSMPVSGVRGAVSQSRRLAAVTQAQIALSGDASGGVDAVTGEGLALAFRQAGVLADALATDELARYEVAHRKLISRPLRMARLLLLMDQHEGVRRRALHALAERPEAFRRFLAIHVGELHPIGASLEIARFGLRLLKPPKEQARANEQHSAVRGLPKWEHPT